MSSAPATSRDGLYALDLITAFAETVLHETLSVASLEARRVVTFRGKPLRLARRYAKWLKALGGTGGVVKVIPYEVPQLWSQAVFRHRRRVDGFPVHVA
jgi:hypothetical protein